MAWTNENLREQFAAIATLLKLKGEDPFRVRAYERAADAIAAARVDLATLDREGLAGLPGIGKSTVDKILEYREHGTIRMLEQLRAEVPDGLIELTRVPGLGPKTAVQLYQELGIDSVEALEAAIDAQQVRELPGLGAKTEENLREGIRRMGAKDTDRVPAADALPVALALCETLAAVPAAEEVAYAGSLRRMRETIGDIDVLVASTDAGAVMEAFRSAEVVREVLAAGEKKSSVLTARGLQADLRVVEPEAWGAALVYFTGSKAHNIRIRERAVRRALMLNEYGLFRREDDGEAGPRVASRTEMDVYAALDMAWVPPPLREDTGEVEAAADGTLPAVVTLDDLRGDLHGHSDWSGDGKVSLDDMVAAAAARGWGYWAVTDHAEGLPLNGLTRERMLARRDAIEALQERHAIAILDGAELNIDGDGGLDYDWDFLLTFDWCVASIHTLMQRGEAAQTERILKAMEHPAVHAIGHPTGRKIGVRPGYDIDLDAVLDQAAETGTALEVNGSPRRLDLGGDLVRRAVERGVTLAISTDAHTIGELDNARWGVLTAQRGWATPADVLNCRDVDGVRAFVPGMRAQRWGRSLVTFSRAVKTDALDAKTAGVSLQSHALFVQTARSFCLFRSAPGMMCRE
jgi:DNA polymerase (family X)